MAALLLDREARSNLRRERTDEENDRWYARLFQEISETPIEDWGNLTIITFNYDRSLETCLVRFMMSSYGWDEARALANVNRLSVHHFFGRLAHYEDPFAHGAGVTVDNVRHAMSGIRIPGETVPGDEQASATIVARSARRLCFLGFGYLPANVSALQIEDEPSRTFLGTGYGLGRGEAESVKRLISTRMAFGGEDEGVVRFMKNNSVFG